MRADVWGGFWHIVGGAVVGAAINLASYYVANKMVGNDFDIGDAAKAAVTGAISGALTASGLGKVAQIVGGAIISAASTTIDTFKDKKLKDITFSDVGGIVASAAMGAAFGRYSGAGLMTSSKVSTQMLIINRNIHCIFRTSAQKAISRSLNHISSELIETGTKFVVSSALGSIYSQLEEANK